MDDILFSVIGWIVILGGALWYVRRTKHPARTLPGAFGLFLAIFGGITIAALFVVVDLPRFGGQFIVLVS